MKKIYITGLAGMLGANIAFLLKENYEICGVDKIPFEAKSIQYEQFDLLDFRKLKGSIYSNKPNYLIHTAALVNVDLCEEEKELANKLNNEVSAYLVSICKEIDCNMIYISTDAVFDGKEEKLYEEKDKTNPINHYGLTKLLGETAVLEQGFTILRTNIYGFNVQNKNSFGEWILSSLLKEDSISLFEDIDFSPILVNDLAKIIEYLIEKNISGLYHACGSGKITKYEFGLYVRQIFNIENGIIYKTNSDSFPFKAKRSKHMGMSNKKLQNVLPFLLPSPKEGILKFYQLYQSGFPNDLKEWGRVKL